jgi:hypothetical protein
MAGIGNQTEELTHKQTPAIATSEVAQDVQSAANAAAISERSLHTWLGDPYFKLP